MSAELMKVSPLFPAAFLLVTLLFILAEFLYSRLAFHDHDKHDAGEILASAGVAVGDILSRVLTAGIAAVPFFYLYNHRLFDIPASAMWSWAILFFGVEFCYYWFHRASHRIRWLWATHATHHSATHFNLSAAIRLGWTGQLTGAFVFFLPLALIGFHPVSIAITMMIGLVYQFFLHTAFEIDLGPMEWVLNTPAHHRVHHASNEGCLDKNYGSVLIVFDRLFQTFAKAPETEPLRFGVKGREPSNNPVRIALGEWAILFRDFKTADGLRNKLRVLFGVPT